MKKIIFIGSSRCYHAFDWYRTIKEICVGSYEIIFLTDLIDGEGFEKLINEDDRIIELFNIDWLLFPNQSKYGNMWRNFIKLVFVPLQAIRLKAIAKENPYAVFHAMPMYYMLLCWIARIPYIGTPQGSEILVRPNKSRLYKYFAIKALLAAKHITVDSVNMQNRIIKLCGKESTVIQNGIDISAISIVKKNSSRRQNVVSIRGFTSLYRINEIFDGRERSLQKPRLHLCYPFWEDIYRSTVIKRLEQGDCDWRRLSRNKLYELLTSTLLAISIPKSDSSPRSIYEAIFCGCCVAVTYNPWIDALPKCMKSRLFIVDLKDNLWFEMAIEHAKRITIEDYKPSEEALALFDQKRSMRKMVDLFYESETKNQICTNCVMDTTDDRIVFDQKGVCDHCNTFYNKILPNWHNPDEREERKLEKIVERIKKEGRGKNFDCILGISGGIDSSYTTYIAKEKLGLRPLVFHVDAGWNSQIAVNNIEKIIDKLGLDLYTEVIDWEEMRDLQLAYFKSGVPHIDVPQDHAFFATMYNFAAKYNVKYILTGANYSTECIRNPVEWMYYQSDSIQLKDIHKKFGKSPLKKFPLTSILRHKVYLRYIRGITVIRPLDYVPYNKEEAMQLLVDHFGWQRYPQKHFESRFTKFYESYWLPKKFGFDTRRVQYSSLILTKQMTRAEALEKLSKPAYDESTIKQDFEYIATKLGISVAELQRYMDAPNKSYRDYRSQRSIYSIGAGFMRMLGLERGGKR